MKFKRNVHKERDVCQSCCSANIDLMLLKILPLPLSLPSPSSLLKLPKNKRKERPHTG